MLRSGKRGRGTRAVWLAALRAFAATEEAVGRGFEVVEGSGKRPRALSVVDRHGPHRQPFEQGIPV